MLLPFSQLLSNYLRSENISLLKLLIFLPSSRTVPFDDKQAIHAWSPEDASICKALRVTRLWASHSCINAEWIKGHSWDSCVNSQDSESLRF